MARPDELTFTPLGGVGDSVEVFEFSSGEVDVEVGESRRRRKGSAITEAVGDGGTGRRGGVVAAQRVR